MKKVLSILALASVCSAVSFALPSGESVSVSERANKEFAGSFEAEGKKHNVKFVRVLYAAEGSERADGSNDVTQLVFDSTDPQGNAVKVKRFQITAKNTGYDELQTTSDGDFKMKSVEQGVKIHIEVPVVNGELQLDKAYVGNLAYNFGTRETRNMLTAETVSDIQLKLTRLELPAFGADSKPGDKGLVYNAGYIQLELSSKAKHIDSDQIAAFTVSIDSPISVTHIRGKERSDRAVMIDTGVVSKNVR